MSGSTGQRDEKEARTTAVLLGALVLIALAGAVFAVPVLSEFNQAYLAEGVGLKDAAIAAFVVTIVVLVVFAVAAGDGLIGELQFMLGGFFAFFLVAWLMIAWIF